MKNGEHWGHTDDELVDRLLVKKGGDEVAGQFGFWRVSFTPWLQPGGFAHGFSSPEPFERFPVIAGRKPFKR